LLRYVTLRYGTVRYVTLRYLTVLIFRGRGNKTSNEMRCTWRNEEVRDYKEVIMAYFRNWLGGTEESQVSCQSV